MNFGLDFQYAGTRPVVVSLWKVAPRETAEYMTISYCHLKEGTKAPRPRPMVPSHTMDAMARQTMTFSTT